MEKIAVIGAAGRTGQAVVKRALAEGIPSLFRA
jgi:uncharacterized protein YbjT (DUF2867 family)